MKYLMAFLIALIVLLGLDVLWLKLFMSTFFRDQVAFFGMYLTHGFTGRVWAALLAYVFMAAGFTAFVAPLLARGQALGNFITGACYGMVLYGVYALTNYAIFAQWPLSLVGVDILWGGFLFGLTSLVIALF